MKILSEVKRGKQQGSTCVFVLLFLVFVNLLLGAGIWYYFSQKPPSQEPSAPVDIVLESVLKKYGVVPGDDVFIRIIKEPKILELWMRPASRDDYVLIKNYPILSMSGQLGPKVKEGDFQAPEGFYKTHARVLNPNSKYHLSFNVCYPNPYDLGQNRTGSFIMVHGGDRSIGCFAMGDPAIEEIYGLVEASVKSSPGNKEIPIHIYPFIPSQERLAQEINNPHYDFWAYMAKAWNWTEQHRKPAPIVFQGNKMVMNDGNPVEH